MASSAIGGAGPPYYRRGLNRTTRDLYTSSLAVEPVSVRPEPFGYAQDRLRAAKSKATACAPSLLFDFAAGAATLLMNKSVVRGVAWMERSGIREG
jgi:hypothetical protein